MVDLLTPHTRAALSLTGRGSRAFYVALALLTFLLPLLAVRTDSGASAPGSQSGMGALPPPSLEPSTRLGLLGGVRKLEGWTPPHALTAPTAAVPLAEPFSIRIWLAPGKLRLLRLRQLRLEGG